MPYAAFSSGGGSSGGGATGVTVPLVTDPLPYNVSTDYDVTVGFNDGSYQDVLATADPGGYDIQVLAYATAADRTANNPMTVLLGSAFGGTLCPAHGVRPNIGGTPYQVLAAYSSDAGIAYLRVTNKTNVPDPVVFTLSFKINQVTY